LRFTELQLTRMDVVRQRPADLMQAVDLAAQRGAPLAECQPLRVDFGERELLRVVRTCQFGDVRLGREDFHCQGAAHPDGCFEPVVCLSRLRFPLRLVLFEPGLHIAEAVSAFAPACQIQLLA
jgi:hypothetical protein